jgi:hypothetical protein
MLREMRLTHAEQRLELADGPLAFGQVTENEQSMRVCEPLEQACGARSIRFHLRGIHDQRMASASELEKHKNSGAIPAINPFSCVDRVRVLLSRIHAVEPNVWVG